jgi:hypothetical protein
MYVLLSLLSHSVMVSVGFLSVVVSPYVLRATRASNFRLHSSTTLVIFGDVHKYGAESWPCRQIDQKHRESLKIWCWRRMEISWTDSVQN